MPLVLFFFNFLFFRIMTAAMFDDPMTIWASAISAIVVTALIVFAIPFGIQFSLTVQSGVETFDTMKLIAVVVITAAISCVAAYLIALGFSEQLYNDISRWRRYRDLFEQDLFWFCTVISVPVVMQLGVQFWRLKKGIQPDL